MGESGMIATPGAVALAVEDALRPLGVQVEALPLAPAAVAERLPTT
jgi:aerobic carbon-monoxide dehydrogenase large subunit